MPFAEFALGAAGLCMLAMMASPPNAYADGGNDRNTATPIRHLVVIFQENVSFDHYFATYPTALNPAGEPPFNATSDTPTVDGLGTLVDGQPDGVLLTRNPNSLNSANGSNAINPFRLDRSQASTCDQDHNYGAEQAAFDQGLMDAFPANTGSDNCGGFDYGKGVGLVMGYFDGNTVTAMWNYAQHYTISDNFFGTTFGPSTPGALNLIAGNTYPATPSASSPKVAAVKNGVGTMVGDLDPTGDACSGSPTVRLGGQNIGDLLNARGVTWGAFMGGFNLSIVNPNGTTGCNRSSPASAANGGPTHDYIPHHAWFQYFASTANPTHTRPNSISEIGHAGPANHQYDLNDFFTALKAGNLPSVSILKAIAANDGHAGYSDPLLEQPFLVNTVNAIMQSPFWKSTAIVITYDDSDGWYDHQMSPIVNASAVLNTSSLANSDQLNAPGKCGNGTPLGAIQGRCGYGPRLVLVTISPYARENFVDHTLTDQSSILRFIEDNWGTGQIGGGSSDQIAGPLTNMFDFGRGDNDRLILDPSTGEPQGY
ncbi:MAG: alkaline phosphatase family protein [Alphaproteobacteria bacterium]|nr:alkaline phosphatase family protein [Alphaproteobacteria bacterium]